MRKVIFALLLILTLNAGFAQPSSNDTSIYNQATNNAISIYHQARGINSELYNGLQFINYSIYIKGFAFFESPDWQTGTIVYYNQVYSNIQLKYDLVKDLLVTKHPNGYKLVTLENARVNSFSVPGSRFVYLDSLSNPSLLRSGFYQQLFNGKLSIVAKKTKVIEENIIAEKLEQKFEEKNFYYALKDSVYHHITNKRSIYSLIDGNTESIKRYLKKNKIKFKRDKESALIKIAEYYQNIQPK
jgi:hypothetical protein